MSRPVPIVPEVLLLGTLPNPGDLERSIRLQLTPGSGPAPEMAMAAAGAPGRAGRLRGPGGRLRGSGLDIGAGLGVSDPFDGSVGERAGAGAGGGCCWRSHRVPGTKALSVSLSYSDARSTQPSPHGLAAGGGLADAPSAPARARSKRLGAAGLRTRTLRGWRRTTRRAAGCVQRAFATCWTY